MRRLGCGAASRLLVASLLLVGCNPVAPTATGVPVTPTPATPTRTTVVFSAGDCLWAGEAKAWDDENANGLRDAGESPLARVVVAAGVGDSFGGRNPRTTDASGRVALGSSLHACTTPEVELRASPPPGYRPTTVARIRVGARDRGPHLFGFARERR